MKSLKAVYLLNRIPFVLMFIMTFNLFAENIRYDILDDPGKNLNQLEQKVLEEWTDDLILFEDFNDHDTGDIQEVNIRNIENGFLRINGNGSHLQYELSTGFTRALVCYRLDSGKGHLFTPIHSENGHYSLFNDVSGNWAWIDFENGHQAIREADFGKKSNRGLWMIHELRVEGKLLSYYVNGTFFSSVPFDKSKKLKNFSIAANNGGTGMVDYIIISGRKKDGETLYNFGDTQIICHDPYKIEAIVRPMKTKSAPFDTVVTPDGKIIISGSKGALVEYCESGDFRRLDIPDGTNFERSIDGSYWYYNFSNGSLKKWTPDSKKIAQIATLPVAYTDGSIAVSPDGKDVYIAWWIRDNNPDLEDSALYRYRINTGLKKILDMPKGVFLRAVEVTPAGKVFIATNRGIYLLRKDNSLTDVLRFKHTYVSSDGLTSDFKGNLYFTADKGNNPGLFRLDPNGNLKQISENPKNRSLAFGLSFNEKTGEVIGVRKKEGELLAMDMKGIIRVLNNPTGLTTPISVKQNPDGSLYVNGDESGLLKISNDGKVIRFSSDLCSYQPPAADFTFSPDGNIYYSEAAPGFESAIIKIDKKGNHQKVKTRVKQPAGIDLGIDGRIYYADYGRNSVMRLNHDGDDDVIISGIPFPVGLVIDNAGSFWISAGKENAEGDPESVEEVSPCRILRYRSGGRLEEIIGPDYCFDSKFTFFDVDYSGNLYLPAGKRLLVRNKSGEIVTAAEGFRYLRGAAVCQDGSIVITDYGNAALYRIRKR